MPSHRCVRLQPRQHIDKAKHLHFDRLVPHRPREDAIFPPPLLEDRRFAAAKVLEEIAANLLRRLLDTSLQFAKPFGLGGRLRSCGRGRFLLGHEQFVSSRGSPASTPSCRLGTMSPRQRQRIGDCRGELANEKATAKFSTQRRKVAKIFRHHVLRFACDSLRLRVSALNNSPRKAPHARLRQSF